MFIRLTWGFIVAGILYFILSDIVFGEGLIFRDTALINDVFVKLFFFIFLIILCIFKVFLFRKEPLARGLFYYTANIIWLFLLSFGINFLGLWVWTYALILLTILVTSLTRGTKASLLTAAASFVMHFAMIFLAYFIYYKGSFANSTEFFGGIWYNLFLYVALFAFSLFCGMIYKNDIENEIENQNLMERLEEKYLQLESAQDEIKTQYEELKGTNAKLEETNSKLSESIAEFYTLQQISQAIGSILDIRELLKYLNDIVLGVIGVSYSTIILYDEKSNRLKVHTTNISNPGELATLVDNVNCTLLFNALNNGQHILENYVDSKHYIFTKNRDINSLICIPLNTKSRKYGLVLVEHKYSNAFDEENVRLMNIIAQQVGIAMENAELYQKMQELANKDGLTGIYNRQYFQTRLELEIMTAQSENYPLSLAIYDIDHFKRFNDTFGHLFGDKVLKSIVEAVSSSLRKNDIFARFGGEEFIILFPHTNLSEAYEKVEALRKMISNHIIKDNLVAVSVTVSFGVSCFKECALTENELLRTADDALYEAKVAGRNCIKVTRRLSE